MPPRQRAAGRAAHSRLGQVIFVSAAALVCGAAGTAAQGVAGGKQSALQFLKHPLTDIPPPAPAVETVAVFPDHRDHVIKQGEPRVNVLLGFRNDGDSPLNVTAITGSINLPSQFSIYVQNLTMLGYGVVVEPHSEITLPYPVMPAPQLAAMDFTLALTAFYHDAAAGRAYASTFFNGTVTFVEAAGLVDYQMVTMLGSLAACVAAGFYWLAPERGAAVLKGLQGKTGKAALAGRPKAKRVDAAAATSPDEWLAGTAWAAEQKAAEQKAARAAKADAKAKAAAEAAAAKAAAKAAKAAAAAPPPPLGKKGK